MEFGILMEQFTPFITGLASTLNRMLGVFFTIEIFGTPIIMFPIAFIFFSLVITNIFGKVGE